MKTRLLPISSPQAISEAVKNLNAGDLVAFPTDTVYGLGAMAFNGLAVESIYHAKDRPAEKAIPILLAGVDDLPRVVLSIPEMALILAASFWPGPLTLVVPKHPLLPQAIASGATVGVRVPGNAVTRELLRLSGPLAVSSANLTDSPSPSTAEEVMQQLGGRIPLILDGGKTPGGVPSTVVDCTGAEPKILRAGPISASELYKSLGLG